MAWTKEHWDKLKKAPLDGPYWENPKGLKSRLDSTTEKSIVEALFRFKEGQRTAGKKRKQKQSWNYG